MCGRYLITSAPDAIRNLFRYPEQPNFPACYNIAPTQPVPPGEAESGRLTISWESTAGPRGFRVYTKDCDGTVKAVFPKVKPEAHAAQVNLSLSMAMSGQGAQAIPLIQPLASVPGASRKLRHDYAAVLAMSGRRAEAEAIAYALRSLDFRHGIDAQRPQDVDQAQTVLGLAAQLDADVLYPLR